MRNLSEIDYRVYDYADVIHPNGASQKETEQTTTRRVSDATASAPANLPTVTANPTTTTTHTHAHARTRTQQEEPCRSWHRTGHQSRRPPLAYTPRSMVGIHVILTRALGCPHLTTPNTAEAHGHTQQR